MEIIVFYVLLFPLPGWIGIGIPAVLHMDVQLLKRLRWVLVILIGSALGVLAWGLLWFSSPLFSGPHHHLNFAAHWGWSLVEWSEILLAMLVSTVAFAVYSAGTTNIVGRIKAAYLSVCRFIFYLASTSARSGRCRLPSR